MLKIAKQGKLLTNNILILRASSNFCKKMQHQKKISAMWLQQSQNGGQEIGAKKWGQQNARTLYAGGWGGTLNCRRVTYVIYIITIVILVLVISVADAVALKIILKVFWGLQGLPMSLAECVLKWRSEMLTNNRQKTKMLNCCLSGGVGWGEKSDSTEKIIKTFIIHLLLHSFIHSLTHLFIHSELIQKHWKIIERLNISSKMFC